MSSNDSRVRKKVILMLSFLFSFSFAILNSDNSTMITPSVTAGQDFTFLALGRKRLCQLYFKRISLNIFFFSPKTMLNSRWALSCSRDIKIALGGMVEAIYRGQLKASVMFFLERLNFCFKCIYEKFPLCVEASRNN